MALTVSVVSRTHTLWEGEAEYVSVPSVEGELGVLPGRQPLLAALREGPVTIHPVSGQSKTLPVASGFASVDRDHVMVVVDEPVADTAAKD